MNFDSHPLLIPLSVSAAWAVAIALIGGLLTNVGTWYRNLLKPSWKPPDWAFGPIWTVILALAAYAAAIAWQGAPTGAARWAILLAMLLNSVFHIAWSGLFFRLRRPDWALVDVALLWFSIAILMFVLGNGSALAALLLVPYLIWVSIAAFLNFEIVKLNGPFPSGRQK